MTELVFGRAPKPPIIDMICPKPFDGAGYYRLKTPRKPVGVCEHITAGLGSIEFYHSFFSTGGERQYDALVDFVIGRDGRIAMLNDPWGTRSPWANGGTDGLEGDGPAFLRTFGVAGVNDRLVSIEHVGRATEDWTPEMWAAAVALDIWLFDRMGVRHDTFPVHQDYGAVVHLLHSEFTGKGGNAEDECPGRYLKRNITRYQDEIRAGLKAAQVTGPVVSDPKPTPKSPAVYPKDMNEEKAKRLFGTFSRYRRNGSVTQHGFDERGVLSIMWLKRGEKEGTYPEALDWFETGETADDRAVVTFANGWVAIKQSSRSGWRWVTGAAK